VADPTGDDGAARAVGLEVTCERYVQTLVRVRRVRRAAWLAARLGPLAGAVPGTDRLPVAVAGGDAREVLGKLWTAGERYRRLRESLDGSGDRVDPGGGRSAASFAGLRRRLTAAPDRARAGDYAAVAAAMADADRAIRDLREARADDCAALAEFDPGRLRTAAEAAAGEMNAAYEARRAARTTTEDEATAGATERDAEDDNAPERTAAETDDGDASSEADEPGPDAAEHEQTAERENARDRGVDADAADPEAVIGSSFDIDVSEERGVRGGAAASADETAVGGDESGDDGDDRATDDESGEAGDEGPAADEADDDTAFEFGVVTDPPADDDRD